MMKNWLEGENKWRAERERAGQKETFSPKNNQTYLGSPSKMWLINGRPV